MNEKQSFLKNEFLTLTLLGAFNTRRHSIYKKNSITIPRKESFKNSVRKILERYSQQYSKSITEEQHILNIKRLAEEISVGYENILAKGHLRIGIAQKLLNLYLKFLWVAGMIKRPCHCPFDSRILSRIGLNNIRWTIIDSIDEYEDIVRKAKEKANNQNLAEWELNLWNQINKNRQ